MLLGILVLALFYLLGKTSAGARPPPEPDAPPGFFDGFLGVAKAYKMLAWDHASTSILVERLSGVPVYSAPWHNLTEVISVLLGTMATAAVAYKGGRCETVQRVAQKFLHAPPSPLRRPQICGGAPARGATSGSVPQLPRFGHPHGGVLLCCLAECDACISPKCLGQCSQLVSENHPIHICNICSTTLKKQFRRQ